MQRIKTFLGIVLLIGLFSCSKENTFPLDDKEIQKSRVIIPFVENQCISVSEFKKLAGTDCQDYELEFLNSLPQDMQVYLYPKGSKNYPKLKQKK